MNAWECYLVNVLFYQSFIMKVYLVCEINIMLLLSFNLFIILVNILIKNYKICIIL